MQSKSWLVNESIINATTAELLFTGRLRGYTEALRHFRLLDVLFSILNQFFYWATLFTRTLALKYAVY